MIDPSLHEAIATASNALGPIVLYFVARNVKAATEALNVSNAQSAANLALAEKNKKDLDELFSRVRLIESNARKAVPLE